MVEKIIQSKLGILYCEPWAENKMLRFQIHDYKYQELCSCADKKSFKVTLASIERDKGPVLCQEF